MMNNLQRASLWRRMLAFLLDAMLLGMAAVMTSWTISALIGYDSQIARVDEAYAHYAEAYGVNFDMSAEEYEALTPEQQENVQEAYDALAADPEATEAYGKVLQMTLLITALSFLLAYVLLEFAVPLMFENGQSLGKKLSGVAVMQQDGGQLSSRALFIRTFLGKYTLETMVPAMMILMVWFGMLGTAGVLVLAGIVIVQLGLMLCMPGRTVIHDALAGTVAVNARDASRLNACRKGRA